MLQRCNTELSPEEFYFQWHVTDRCNLRCSHCYQESYSGSSEMSLEELRAIADKLFSTLLKWKLKGRISLTGGEPLLKKDLFPLLEYLEKSNQICKLSILTNGTLLNEKIVSSLENFSKLHYVQVSIDGANPETNDAIRGKGSFEKAIHGIRLLRKKDIKVRLMFTLHKRNAKEVPALIDLALREGVSALTVDRLVPTGSGRKINDLLLSPEEIHNGFRYISDRADLEYERGSPLTILKYRTLYAILDPSRLKANANIPIQRELGAACSIGIDSLCILPDATVLPCRRLPIPIGNLKSDSVFKIWYTSDLLWKIRDKRNLKGKCNSCELIPVCSGCRSMAYAYTGDYLEEDPQCWK